MTKLACGYVADTAGGFQLHCVTLAATQNCMHYEGHILFIKDVLPVTPGQSLTLSRLLGLWEHKQACRRGTPLLVDLLRESGLVKVV